MNPVLTQTEIEGLKLYRRGKVRDVYDLGDELLIVATDRLSAFDHVLPTPIPGKGRILTEISALWFELTRGIVDNHLVSTDLSEIRRLLPAGARLDPSEYEGRVTLARKAQRIDAECVVRGYLAGSGWKEYQRTGEVCGQKLPRGLVEAAKLPNAIFTPATKNDEGHDENISRERLVDLVGKETAEELERASLRLYQFASARLGERGVILADTKFEFGMAGGRIILIDELLTPDSSRLWPAKDWRPGGSPPSFDKQFVRDYLESVHWDKKPPAPALPTDVAEGTARRYREFLRIAKQ